MASTEPIQYAAPNAQRVSYLQRIVDLLDQPEVHTDKTLLLEGVWAELSTSIIESTPIHTPNKTTIVTQPALFAVSACVDKQASSLLERILQHSSALQIDNFVRTCVGAKWSHLILHPFASRVFDTSIRVVVNTCEDSSRREILTDIANWIMSSGQMEQLTTSRCACPCLKNLIRAMTQANMDEKFRSRFRHHIVQSCNLEDVLATPHGSSLIQVILLDESGLETEESKPKGVALAQTPKIARATTNKQTPCFDSVYAFLTADQQFFEESTKDTSRSRLVEVIINIMAANSSTPTNTSDKTLASLYSKYMRHKLTELSAHPVANFVVQKLIECSAVSLPLYKLIFNEVQDQLATFFQGRSGIVMKLVQLGVLHKEVQKDLVKYLVRALARVRALSSNTNENEENGQSEEQTENAAEKDTDAQPSSDDINKTRKEIASILIHLKNAAKNETPQKKRKVELPHPPTRFSPIGCAILAALFDYRAELVNFVITSFTELDFNEYLFPMATDSAVSFVLEKFLSGTAVNLKAKQTILDAFMGHYGKLAMNNVGSHIVDKAFRIADVTRKGKIAAEIVAIEQDLSTVPHGKFVLRNCRIQTFKTKQEAWKKNEEQIEKRRQLFADILNDEEEEKPKPEEAANEEAKQSKRKRKRKEEMDEIDLLFRGIIKKEEMEEKEKEKEKEKDVSEPPAKRKKKEKKKDKKEKK